MLFSVAFEKSMNFAWNSKPFRSRIEVQRRTSSENYLRNYIKTWLKNTRIKLWNEVNFTSKFLFSSSTVFTMFLLPQQTTSHTSLCKQNEERLFNTFVNLDWQKVVGFFFACLLACGIWVSQRNWQYLLLLRCPVQALDHSYRPKMVKGKCN